MKSAAFILCWLWSLAALCAEVIPPAPPHYFNDDANVVPAATAAQLNAQLEDFERATGNQIVVAVYPKMQSDSAIADYAVRVFRAWGVGQKSKNNGVVLFVFIQDRQMFIVTGYGLEGALPDALCKQITEYEIKPRFQAGDYAGGLTAGVNAILAATQHEYKGTGTTVNEGKAHSSQNVGALVIIILIIFIVLFQLLMASTRRHGWLISSGGWGGDSGGGGWGGGGWGGGGGFSGGGGSSGGGGAGSSW